ncbi:SOS response-associated peptidase [Patescibacteria group bacterium]|uniref:Putative SOS response associated peptidase n=1 Tax=viral metagenome TaxID=1070528 RepID=A0A6M3X4S4_9ZZZZ|nr:SOS response-associated peptidase [Patescibacteria group bacterium]MBU0846968.1 SOS response-associated peptidase [Patescibacteria group bacterium]
MCGSAKIKGSKACFGTVIAVDTKAGSQRLSWGIGSVTNARMERLNSVWSPIQNNRCIMSVDSFYEGSARFANKSGEMLHLAGVFHKSKFVTLTQPSEGAVKEVHNRMPVFVNPDKYLSGNTACISNVSLVKVK